MCFKNYYTLFLPFLTIRSPITIVLFPFIHPFFLRQSCPLYVNITSKPNFIFPSFPLVFLPRFLLTSHDSFSPSKHSNSYLLFFFPPFPPIHLSPTYLPSFLPSYHFPPIVFLFVSSPAINFPLLTPFSPLYLFLSFRIPLRFSVSKKHVLSICLPRLRSKS